MLPRPVTLPIQLCCSMRSQKLAIYVYGWYVECRLNQQACIMALLPQGIYKYSSSNVADALCLTHIALHVYYSLYILTSTTIGRSVSTLLDSFLLSGGNGTPLLKQNYMCIYSLTGVSRQWLTIFHSNMSCQRLHSDANQSPHYF